MVQSDTPIDEIHQSDLTQSQEPLPQRTTDDNNQGEENKIDQNDQNDQNDPNDENNNNDDEETNEKNSTSLALVQVSGTVKLGNDTRLGLIHRLPGDERALSTDFDVRSIYDLPKLKKKKYESSFHRFSTLICPICLYAEIPGCRTHDQALSVEKGNGHSICHPCLKLANHYQCSTDTGSPWNSACRNCSKTLATVGFNVISDQVSELSCRALYTESQMIAMNHETSSGSTARANGEFIIFSILLRCEDCLTCAFPMYDGRFTRFFRGHILPADIYDQMMADSDVYDDVHIQKESKIDPKLKQSQNGLTYITTGTSLTGELPDKYKKYELFAEDFYLEHYLSTCRHEAKAVPIYMSKGETVYGATACISTPRLPLDKSL
jgi:hypothetical protein